jgi:hypothetical protein
VGELICVRNDGDVEQTKSKDGLDIETNCLFCAGWCKHRCQKQYPWLKVTARARLVFPTNITFEVKRGQDSLLDVAQVPSPLSRQNEYNWIMLVVEYGCKRHRFPVMAFETGTISMYGTYTAPAPVSFKGMRRFPFPRRWCYHFSIATISLSGEPQWQRQPRDMPCRHDLSLPKGLQS